MSRPAKSKKVFQTLKGFKDILPDEQKYWSFIYDRAYQTALDYGFRKIDLPILEEARLFIKGSGQETDMIEKEFYAFEDKSSEKVALRPEFTPQVIRAYIEHGMINLPQPVKLFSFGPIFRHNNPQAGRLRQFHQFNYEVLGAKEPEIDAQLIIMVFGLYKSFGLDVVIQINSIGCQDCRPFYIKQFKKFLKGSSSNLCDDCKIRIDKNPLRILDCKEEACRILLEGAPQIVDSLCESCREHFMKVLESLDEMDVVYNLNPYLVRGLDYYLRTTFEIFLTETEKEEHNIEKSDNKLKLALGGGGRYDGLAEILGGRQTPAIGFAGGVERVISALKQQKVMMEDPTKADIFVAQLGEEARKKSRRLFEDMRRAGFRVREAFSKTGLKAQLEVAGKLQVRYSLILGQKEILDGTIIVRDMESGIQEIIPFNHIMEEMRKRVDTGGGVRIYHQQKKEEIEVANGDKQTEKTGDEIKNSNTINSEELVKEADRSLEEVESGEIE